MEARRELQVAGALLADWALTSTQPEAHRLDVDVDVANLLAAVQALVEAQWGYLAAITGLDLAPEVDGLEAGAIEACYHFCAGPAIVTLRIRLQRQGAEVPTICGIIPSAGFFERELSEMLGVTIQGAPNSQHLFLPEGWPEGVYPLRKDFQPSTLDGSAGYMRASIGDSDAHQS